ncbi:hypothetical protein BDN67DRAFT_69906 [Paxillus ammoniavirescens]|nr:hypothetical protein BDN67DRAFT_69906 [Paxillus ammoniavirescens]
MDAGCSNSNETLSDRENRFSGSDVMFIETRISVFPLAFLVSLRSTMLVLSFVLSFSSYTLVLVLALIRLVSSFYRLPRVIVPLPWLVVSPARSVTVGSVRSASALGRPSHASLGDTCFFFSSLPPCTRREQPETQEFGSVLHKSRI